MIFFQLEVLMSFFDLADNLYNKAINKQTSPHDLDTVIEWPDDKLSILFACCDQVRRHFFNDRVSPCAIMNIKSGGCSEDCAFCSQSSHNKATVSVKPMSERKQILDAYSAAQHCDLDFGVVSSGRKLSPSDLHSLIDTISSCEGPVHASLGILSDEEFRKLRQAGVVCYNHNLETSRNHFSNIVTTHNYDQRIKTVKRAKAAGMSVCCGGIFGMGERWEDRKDLCMELRNLDVDTVPINFLNAIEGTRVGRPKESPLEFLKIVALFRIGLPDKNIKVCGGREVNLGKLQGMMFYAGANGYISGDYLTTSGDSIDSDDTMLKGLGLKKS
ncbi:MAG: biotin synthase BioB [Fibrobacterota bacterium]